MGKSGKTYKDTGKQGELGENIEKHEETRETQGKQENTQNIYIYRGHKYRILHGKCWRTVFMNELLTYQKSNE